MLTFTGTGTLADQLTRAKKLERKIAKLVRTVTRTKVELDIDSINGAFVSWFEARNVDLPWLYAEQHLKISIDGSEATLADLARVATTVDGHLSRSAFGSGENEEHRFVTKRSADHFLPSLISKFEVAEAVLTRAGYKSVKTSRELVVFDSNLALDDGWLPATTPVVGLGQPREAKAPSNTSPVLPESPRALTDLPHDSRLDQPTLFDPALKHHRHAYRLGEAVHDDLETERAWRATRRGLFDSVLEAIAESDLRDHLVARGSVLLAHYLGDRARPPGDIDFVVQPVSLTIDSDEAAGLFAAMRELLAGVSFGDATVDADRAVMDSIWTYDRVPGRRMTTPWTAPGLPSGTIQMDFVFNEELWAAPEAISLPGSYEGPSLLAAGAEQSLAWKIMWLASDDYPQGKDLYDAVLLAEFTSISSDLLFRALTDNHQTSRHVGADMTAQDVRAVVARLRVDWAEFVKDNPLVGSSVDPWLTRLADSITANLD